jgi:transposase
MEDKTLTVKELAKRTGKAPTTIYSMIQRIGRMPTEQEVLAVKRGRPNKYTTPANSDNTDNNN